MRAICRAVAGVVALAATYSASAAVVLSTTPGSAASYAAPAGSTSVLTFDNANGTVAEANSIGLTATLTGLARRTTANNNGGQAWTNSQGASYSFVAPAPSDGSYFFGIAGDGASSLKLLGTQAFSNVSLFIGSIEASNLVSLLDASGNVISSFTGAQIYGGNPPSPGDSSSTDNMRVTFTGTSGTAIYGLLLSNGNSGGGFEFDNVAFTNAPASVPEPATWAMMLVGFGAIGFAMRRRTTATTALS